MKRILLAVALALGTSQAFGGELPVSGTGHVYADPDEVMVSASVAAKNESAVRALSKNMMTFDKVVEALKGSDLKVDTTKDLQTTNLRVNALYKRTNDDLVFDGYGVDQSFTVCCKNPKQAGQLLDLLIKNGASVDGVHFQVKNRTQLVDEARKLAAKDAKRKAALLADATDVNLGAIKTVSESEYSNREYSLALRDAAPGKGLASGQMAITVTVNITYEITDKTAGNKPKFGGGESK